MNAQGTETTADSRDIFRCPRCGGGLTDVRDFPKCASCRREFPVVNGIPRFVEPGNYCDSFGLQWNRHRKAQLDKFNGFHFSRDRLFAQTGWPQDLRGQRVLEAGSGAGRFTQILLETGAEVYSFDYSRAVDANRENNGQASNLLLFQADIYHIPLEKGSFDKVLCLGVLQHTPDPSAAFAGLAQYLKPGGQIVIDVYRKSLVSLMHWKYLLRPLFRRMDRQRLYALMEKWVDRMIVPAAVFRKMLGPLGARLLPIAEYSHLGLSAELNREWALLDTFDMYAPAFDLPQTSGSVERWFARAGLTAVSVEKGYNGLVARGKKKA
ncbi:MAG TPA: methyltransferase domain-containing protein [Candidatus Omnitrophota bacterium]|nr:methyltransferase domain-containing protein [Candidatus Omnitrophota bacterium]HRZ15846.1 methyltransferase domain-containing protein [Candidatus Omnitrophota bacterium]